MKTNPRRISADELYSLLSDSSGELAYEHLRMGGTTGIAIFENQTFDSSEFGMLAFIPYGPERQHKTLAEIKDSPVGQVPSTFMWCTMYYNQCMADPVDGITVHPSIMAIEPRITLTRGARSHTYKFSPWRMNRIRLMLPPKKEF